jgi:hypothetical protein
MTLLVQGVEYFQPPIPLKFGMVESLIPVVRRLTVGEHFPKHEVGVIAALAGALGVVNIHPGRTRSSGR